MKHAREIKVGILAAVCLFLLFFGFNFLKGVNIFSPTNSFHGVYDHLHGLEEQAAVYIRGHKVGQVDAIHYDYTRDSAFTIDLSINRDIVLPQGTRMALISDGLLGGMAIELQLPSHSPLGTEGASLSEAAHSNIQKGSFLPTTYVPGLMESLQGELLAHLDSAIQDVDQTIQGVDSLVAGLRGQVEVTSEQFSLHPLVKVTTHRQTARSHNTSYEEPYQHAEGCSFEGLATLPVLLSGAGDLQMLVGESDVDDYPHAFLRAGLPRLDM